MVSDVEIQLPLHSQEQENSQLEWSALVVILEGDNKLGLQKTIQDYGARAALFLSGGSRQETSIYRATKVGAIECLNILLGVRPFPEIVDQPDIDGLSPFLAATKSTNSQVMEILIKAGANVNFRNDKGNHALHILVEELVRGKSQSSTFDCLDLLLNSKNIDLDPRNNADQTPLFYIANEIDEDDLDSINSNNLLTFSRRLYEKGAFLEATDGTKTAKTILSEKGVLSAVQVNDNIPLSKKPWMSHVFDILLLDKDVDMIEEIMKDKPIEEIKQIVNSYLGSKTLLIHEVDRMSKRGVAMLLEKGADPWKTCSGGEMPIHRALARGHNEILEIILKYMKHKNSLDLKPMSFGLFSQLFENHKKTEQEINGVNRSKCLHRLFHKDVEIDVNDQRESKKNKENVLHVAASFGNQEALRLLLENGAFLGARRRIYNTDYGTILEAINFQTLEGAMDNLISHYSKQQDDNDDQAEDVLDHDYTLSLDYRFLVPPQLDHVREEPLLNEVDTLMDIKDSNFHKKIIKHPLIQAFLYAKWRKTLPLYAINLSIYLAFVILLTFLMYCLTDLRVLEAIPVKGLNMSEANKLEEDKNYYSSIVFVFKILIIVPLVYMILREFFQIYFTYKNYLKNIENYLEWFLLITVIVLLSFNLNVNITRHLSAWAMIIAWYVNINHLIMQTL